MYDDERAIIDVEIKYERNIIEYVSKPTETNNRTRFLLHLDLYSFCNYWSSHDLTLDTSIKTSLGNLNGITLLILNASIKACLSDLSGATFDCLNYLGIYILNNTSFKTSVTGICVSNKFGWLNPNLMKWGEIALMNDLLCWWMYW
jgi:hypothetical protein